MRRALGLFVLLFCLRPQASHASPPPSFRVEISASAVHGTLYLLESLRGESHHSTHLKEYFTRMRGLAISEDRRELDEYRMVLESWSTTRVPGDGGRHLHLEDVLEAMAARCVTDEEFLRQAEAILNVAEHARLRRVFAHFSPLYRGLIWEPCHTDFDRQVAQLRAMVVSWQMGARLAQVAACVQSSWPTERDFTVAVTPIPKQPNEHFTTFGHSNGSLEVMELRQGGDPQRALGVAFHELVHSLWAERPAAVVLRLRDAFNRHGGGLAYQELNEGLATALGNGWFPDMGCGKPAAHPWYDDHYIDAFASDLRPLLRLYVSAGRTLDSAFAEQAADAFSHEFPRAQYDPALVLREYVLISNSPQVEKAEVVGQLMSLGRVHAIHTTLTIDAARSRRRCTELAPMPVVFLLAAGEQRQLAGYFDKAQLSRWQTQLHKKPPFCWWTRWHERLFVFCVGNTLDDQLRGLRALMKAQDLSAS